MMTMGHNIEQGHYCPSCNAHSICLIEDALVTCKVAATTASAKMHLIVLIAWIGTAIPIRLATYPPPA